MQMSHFTQGIKRGGRGLMGEKMFATLNKSDIKAQKLIHMVMMVFRVVKIVM